MSSSTQNTLQLFRPVQGRQNRLDGSLLVRPAEIRDAGHSLHSEFPWAGRVYQEFGRIMEDTQSLFPCLFARRAHQSDKLLFLLAGSPDEQMQLQRVRAGLLEYLAVTDTLKGMDASMNALVIFFAPEEPALSLTQYHRQAWGVLQDWIDHDPQPWPTSIPADPDHPLWSICFRGVPLFVNVSCPAHVRRRSRNVGPSLSLILQPRAGFDLVAGATPRGDAIRAKIRQLMEVYDGMPAPDDLGTYTRRRTGNGGSTCSWKRTARAWTGARCGSHHDSGARAMTGLWPPSSDDNHETIPRLRHGARAAPLPRRKRTMKTQMPRTPEPEHMEPIEELHYARADYATPHEAFVDEVLAAVGPRSAAFLADLGCGPGDILLRLSKRGLDWHLHGLDLSERMLGFARLAEERPGAHAPIQWLQADIKATGLPAGSFDVIISNSVLHHLKDAVQFWHEVGLLARPGAVVLVRDLRRPADEVEARAIIARHISAESPVVQNHYFSSLCSAYTVPEVRAQLQAAGLAGLKVREVADRYLDVSGQLQLV